MNVTSSTRVGSRRPWLADGVVGFEVSSALTGRSLQGCVYCEFKVKNKIEFASCFAGLEITGLILLRDRAGKSERRASEDVIEGESARRLPTDQPILAEVATSGLKTWQAKQQPTHPPAMHKDVIRACLSQPNLLAPEFRLGVQTINQPEPVPGTIQSKVSSRKSWLIFSLDPSLFRFVERARPVAKHPFLSGSTLLIIRDPARL